MCTNCTAHDHAFVVHCKCDPGQRTARVLDCQPDDARTTPPRSTTASAQYAQARHSHRQLDIHVAST